MNQELWSCVAYGVRFIDENGSGRAVHLGKPQQQNKPIYNVVTAVFWPTPSGSTITAKELTHPGLCARPLAGIRSSPYGFC
jgi:hypothetical protein